jgi:hypothetical protein
MTTPTTEYATKNCLCVATRIHSMPQEVVSFENNLLTFIENGTRYSNVILIAIKASVKDFSADFIEHQTIYKLTTKVISTLPHDVIEKVTVLPILEWGAFTTALNTLLFCAGKMEGVRYILYKSFEVRISQKDIGSMVSELDKNDTLVVGARLNGHDFKCSSELQSNVVTVINGRTVPWNTYV